MYSSNIDVISLRIEDSTKSSNIILTVTTCLIEQHVRKCIASVALCEVQIFFCCNNNIIKKKLVLKCWRIKYSTQTHKSSGVSLTVHLSVTFSNDQLDAQIFNTFITILYMYMFRAISCSSSGGQSELTFKNRASYI